MTRTRALDRLVSRMEACLSHLPDDSNPIFAALRARVDREILDTWTVVALEQERDRHRRLIGAAALLALSAGFFAGKAVAHRN